MADRFKLSVNSNAGFRTGGLTSNREPNRLGDDKNSPNIAGQTRVPKVVCGFHTPTESQRNEVLSVSGVTDSDIEYIDELNRSSMERFSKYRDQCSGYYDDLSEEIVCMDDVQVSEQPPSQTDCSSVNGKPSRKLEANEIAKKVMEKFHISLNKGNLIIFDETCYIPLTKTLLSAIVTCHYEEYINRSGNGNILRQVHEFLTAQCKAKSECNKTSSRFQAFADCIYDVETGNLQEPDPKYIILNRVEVPLLNQPPDCPICDEFFSYIADGDDDIYDLLWQVTGYIISGDMNAKKFFVVQGNGDTGKSLFIRLIRSFFEPNITEVTIPVRELGKRFSLGNLAGIMLITDGDYVGEQLGLDAVAVIKTITGGDSIRTEAKNIDPISITPVCRLMIGSNYKVMAKENDPAFSKRMVTIPFRHIVTDKDPHLIDKLIKEKPAIALKALGYYQDLRKSGYAFAQPAPLDTSGLTNAIIYELVEERGNTSDEVIRNFVKEHCTLSTDSVTTSADLFSVYNAFCQEKGIMPKNQKTFSAGLHALYKLEKVKKGTKNAYKGIALRS